MKAADIIKAVPEGGVDEFTAILAAIERLAGERDGKRQEIRKLVAARDGLLLVDDDVAVDKLDRKKAALHRDIEKVDLIIPRLEARIGTARDELIRHKVAKHRAIALAQVKKVVAAARALAKENEVSVHLYGEALADIQFAKGVAEIPRTNMAGPAGPDVDWYEGVMMRNLGVIKPPPALAGVSVEVVVPHGPYAIGNRIGLAPEKVQEAVNKGMVRLVEGATLPPMPPKPSQAPAPEPDANGRVVILALGILNPFGLHGGTNWPGDVCSAPVATATRYVRAGLAEFWTPPAAEGSV